MYLAHRSTPSNHILPDQPQTHSPTSHTSTTAPTPTSAGTLLVNRESIIAPWDDPPTPPPKASRTFGFPSKGSFSTFTGIRHGSSTTLFRQPRKSDLHSTLSTSEDKRRSADDDLALRPQGSASSATPGAPRELHKSKSSIFSKLTRSWSCSGLCQDSLDSEHPSLKPPPPVPDAHPSFLPIPGPAAHTSPTTLSKKDKRDKKKKHSGGPCAPSPLPAPDASQPEITLDLNLDVMDGIVDLTQPSGPTHETSASSPSSGLDSSTDQSSLYSIDGLDMKYGQI